MSQWLALAWLKWKLFTHTRLDLRAITNVIALAVAVPVFAVISLSVGAGVHFGAAGILRRGSGSDLLLALDLGLLGLMVIWQLLPILSGTRSRDETFDPVKFLGYPIAPGRLVAANATFVLATPAFLFFAPALLGLWMAVVRVRPSAALPGALVLAAFLAMNATLYHLLGSVANNLLRHRRLRELAAIFVPVIAGTLYFLPSLVGWLQKTGRIGSVAALAGLLAPTPSGMAARAIRASMDGSLLWPAGAVLALAMLAGLFHLWDVRLVERLYRGAGVGADTRRPSAPTRLRGGGWWLPGLPGRFVAILEKETKYLLRSTMGRWFLFRIDPAASAPGRFGLSPAESLYLGIVLLESLVVTGFFSNAFGWESHGIRTYLLSPIGLEQVLWGKTLACFAYFGALFLWMTGVYALIVVPPPPTLVLFTALAVLVQLGVTSLVGYFQSVYFPRRIDYARLYGREGAAFLSGLLGSAAFFAATVPIALAGLVAFPMRQVWIGCALLGLLAGALALAHFIAGGILAGLIASRQERLIEAIVSEE
ncbi:MAG: hypothetical protein HYY93_03695 [Planctomycetes bacterium]|nr:hypothetical protein [Planctomycetota bacterium]